MNKEQYIKRAFKNYYKNKQRLRELSFDTVRGIDYTKATSKNGTPKGHEQALVCYLDEKRELEKQVEIVERTLDWYRVQERAKGCGKAEYIRHRFIKNMSFARAGIECCVGSTTASYWLNEIRETAAAIADIYTLWGC